MSESGYNPAVLEALYSVVLATCMVHPADLDVELGRRALPWLPPDLARQVARRPRDFARGAAAAAAWPEGLHHPGGPKGLEAALIAQCERTADALRSRANFSEVVAGLGTVAHLTLDLSFPFANRRGHDPHAQAFASYLQSCSPRVPIVFYGQKRALVTGSAAELAPFLLDRSLKAAALGSLVHDDLNRHGGPNAWRRLDDRSTSFAAASLTLNHAITLYANLASWVWQQGGGLVPEVRSQTGTVLVWKGEPKPREITSSRLGLR